MIGDGFLRALNNVWLEKIILIVYICLVFVESEIVRSYLGSFVTDVNPYQNRFNARSPKSSKREMNRG